jgi:phosphoribosyl-AMP cyclohydrolase / phosphoribosyl-ATP pyrophosphohydrolase
MIKLDDRGLFPAIAQNAETGEVLMLGWMSPGSLKRTLESGEVWFYSRSRADLWHKGEMSGNYMRVRSVVPDCDGDVVLIKVDPDGPICHTGEPTCFFAGQIEAMPEVEGAGDGSGIIEELFSVIQDRKAEMPDGSYTTELFEGGPERIGQKVVEEAGETAIAAVAGRTENLPEEIADLLYHTLVLMSASGVTPKDVWSRLRQRRR